MLSCLTRLMGVEDKQFELCFVVKRRTGWFGVLISLVGEDFVTAFL
jgi:hypothetical protein